MKQQPLQFPIKIKRKAYICADLDDASLWKTIAQKVSGVVEKFGGEVIQPSYLIEKFTIEAVFPHRKLKALEEAVRHALAGLPVREVVVWPTDPFKLRRNRAA